MRTTQSLAQTVTIEDEQISYESMKRSKCSLCESFQLKVKTALHFVFVCPTIAKLRTRTFGKPLLSASEFAEVC
jgi:hypothetical protein